MVYAKETSLGISEKY